MGRDVSSQDSFISAYQIQWYGMKLSSMHIENMNVIALHYYSNAS
jgi:hypothetical protein